ncbi:MAG TPA: glutamine-hydrolyzing GMP synthase [Armatimonadota bacterium]
MDTLAILDYGGQYVHLIAKRIRALNVFSVILDPDANLDAVPGLKGVILSGGPNSVYDPDAPPLNSQLLDPKLPVLGLCYGHHLMAHYWGGRVTPGATKEYGFAQLRVGEPVGVLEGLGAEEQVWMSHGDTVAELPSGFRPLASTADCPVAVMGDPERGLYGLQFHPEVTHTQHGLAMLDNFLRLCGCSREWTMGNFVESAVADIRSQVGERNVFLFVSGGVDSTVAFALCNRALGEERVLGVHIDNGFMRQHETHLVEQFLRAEGFTNLRVVDASERFLSAVAGVTDPQEKRRIIGRVFVDVRDEVITELGLDPNHWMLGQGTLYPDIIESGGTAHAAVIKTHHNRVDVIQELLARGMVVEPLSQLYKDEVREVGRNLRLPAPLLERHPFPGPGLSVRCLCSTGASDPVPPSVEAHVQEVAGRFGLRSHVLPVRSVGVQGDFRTYAHPAVLVGEVDWENLERASTAITNEVREVNRVVLLLRPSELPPLEPHAATLTRERLDLLREADDLAMRALAESGEMGRLFQMPTILLPLSAGEHGECVVLRPMESTDVMTARFAALKESMLQPLADALMGLPGVEAIFYDITHKPPGTMEWE